MIRIDIIDASISENAAAIHRVFQASFAKEAAMLNIPDFPPLLRTIKSFLNSKHKFWGCWKDDTLVAMMEISLQAAKTQILNMAVHPEHFRQGIASAMLLRLFEKESGPFVVETGVHNQAAVQLYQKHGFQPTREWMHSIGVRKMELRRR